MSKHRDIRQISGVLRQIFRIGSMVALLSLLLNSNVAIADTNTTFVRENISTFIKSPQKLDALKKGIAAMKSLPYTNTSSWIYQANIHGTYDSRNLPVWNTCQHGSYFFFPWHRMYLYYFERILRKASGDATLALPYWNYSDDDAQRAIPDPLRIPANSSNPLYESNRANIYNQGQKLNTRDVSYTTAFNATNFTSSTQSLGFGGGKVPGAAHFGNQKGLLESQPHDIIHVRIGGQGGFMTDPSTAARDPIFWLHHANIDRLWERWLQLDTGRSNPKDPDFLNQQFSFFDENGKQVNLKGSEILDIVSKLDYRYDDTLAKASVVSPPLQKTMEAISQPDPIKVSATPESRESIEISATPQPREVSTTPVTLSVPLPVVSLERQRPLAGSPFILKIQGVEYNPSNLVPYEIYLNLPPGKVPDPEGPYYAGTLALFAYPQGSTVSLDVTDVVRKLKNSNLVKNDNISVTIVPPQPGQFQTSGEAENRSITIQAPPVIRFKQVTINGGVTP